MMRGVNTVLPLLAVALACCGAAAQPLQQARCSVDHAPDQPCTMTDTVRDGVHHMTFQIDDRQVTFVGRSQTGWWSGKLDGRPAMGFERNRGNTIFSTRDLKMTFAWWYPGREHGTY